MELFIGILIALILALTLSIILLIIVLHSIAPFKRMKGKEIDECYDIRQLYKNNKK